MFKQIILPILGVIAFLILVGFFLQKYTSTGLVFFSTPEPILPSQKTISINSTKIKVRISDSSEERITGLSGITSLDKNSGMLFIFDSKGVTPLFWMKGMLIPLDMIWIQGGKVVKIDKDIPIPDSGMPDSQIKTYSPDQPIDYILEVNAGFSDKNKIKPGDSVDLSAI